MKVPHIVFTITLVAAAACFSDRTAVLEPDDNPCTVPGTAISRDNALVLVRGFSFLQDTVRIQRGKSVTWVNCEAPNVEPHTSTSEDDVWDSGPVAPGESFTRTFDQAGTFRYFCRPHPSMRGVVIVH
ncbi:hypothetical protein BH23GEM10_BH23GEM10_08190 [soil metagenome]